MNTRVRREVEPAWVSWYCAKHHADDVVKYRCPLGPIPQEMIDLHGLSKALRVYRPWRPEVDALIITDNYIRLIEAKIQKFMNGLSKLPVYKALVTETPELKPWWNFPIQMVLLIPTRIGWVVPAASKLGISIVTESPPEIQKIWNERDKYWTKDLMQKREQRKEVLKKLGYE